jgi:hypothetical protein
VVLPDEFAPTRTINPFNGKNDIPGNVIEAIGEDRKVGWLIKSLISRGGTIGRLSYFP